MAWKKKGEAAPPEPSAAIPLPAEPVAAPPPPVAEPKKPELPAECCVRCRFYQVVREKPPDGRCRRFPEHHQPHTEPAEWCGEFSARK